MDRRPVSFIPGLFRAQNANARVEEDDPFVHQEVLQEYCSLFAADGIPSNIRDDPYVAEIIKFSDEDFNDIAQIQNQREKQQKEEEEKRKEQERAGQMLKKKLELKVEKIFNEKAFYLKKQCPVKIPYKSSLTHEEHAAYLRVFLTVKRNPSMSTADIPGFENYLRLQHRVYEEQGNFMKFSHQVARLELPAYNTVPEVITKYINEYVQHRCKRAFKYKEHYVTEQQVPICPQNPDQNFSKLSFTHIGHVLSLGTLPLFKIPQKYKPHTLKIDDTISDKEHVAHTVVQDKNVLYDTPVSVDQNAQYLAQQHRANIVISTSALKVLADNHSPSFDKDWDIPVEVKSYLITDPDGTQTQHRVVYIDKPMPKKIWTPLEKKQLYFKKAALAAFTEIKRNKIFRMRTPFLFKYSEVNKSDATVTSRTIAEYDDHILDFSHTTDSDIFGDESSERIKCTVNSKKRKKNEKGIKKSVSKKIFGLETDKLQVSEGKKQKGKGNTNCGSPEMNLSDIPPKAEGTDDSGRRTEAEVAHPKNRKSSVEEHSLDREPIANTQDNVKQVTSGSSSENFLDNLLSMQDSLLKPSHTKDNETEDQTDETLMSSKTAQRPWTNRLSTDWKNHFEPHVCRDWTGKNVHYQLFSLGPDTSHSTCSLWPIRILVRSNLHGLSHFKYDTRKCKAYVAYPKIENQAFFGCEVSTWSEVAQQWVQLLVRPNTALFNLRVCEGSGEILMTEDKDLAEILKDGKQLHVGFSPHQPLATFYSVFSAVLGQPTGHYLLHHNSKTEAFIQLMKAVDPDKETNLHTYSLHKTYAAASVSTRVYTAPPWLAIDTHVLTPFHKKHKKIPGTFPMHNPKKKITKTKRRKHTAKAKTSNLKKSLQDLDDKNEDEFSAF